MRCWSRSAPLSSARGECPIGRSNGDLTWMMRTWKTSRKQSSMPNNWPWMRVAGSSSGRVTPRHRRQPVYCHLLGRARTLLSLVQHAQDPALLIEVQWMVGVSSFFLGEFGSAQKYWEQGIALYAP